MEKGGRKKEFGLRTREKKKDEEKMKLLKGRGKCEGRKIKIRKGKYEYTEKENYFHNEKKTICKS